MRVALGITVGLFSWIALAGADVVGTWRAFDGKCLNSSFNYPVGEITLTLNANGWAQFTESNPTCSLTSSVQYEVKGDYLHFHGGLVNRVCNGISSNYHSAVTDARMVQTPGSTMRLIWWVSVCPNLAIDYSRVD